MRARDFIALGIALVVALVIALITKTFLMSDAPPPQTIKEVEQIKQVEVLVASGHLSVGTKLSAVNMKWQPWPESSLDAAYITKGEKKIEDLVGNVVRYPISQGEPLTPDDIIDPNGRGSLAAVLDEGKRAISIDVNAATASSGLIHPGDYVDVILSRVSAGDTGTNSVVSEKLVQNVKVVAIDQQLDSTDKSKNDALAVPKTATLELTPSQAEVLAKGAKEGELYLSLISLRSPDDDACKDGACDEKSDSMQVIKLIRGKEIKDVYVKDVK